MTKRNPMAKALKDRRYAPKKVKPRKGKGSYKRKDPPVSDRDVD